MILWCLQKIHFALWVYHYPMSKLAGEKKISREMFLHALPGSQQGEGKRTRIFFGFFFIFFLPWNDFSLLLQYS